MQMSDFIRSNLEQILSDWEEFAATLLPAAAGLDAEVLRDFAAEMLGRVAEDMEVGQTRAQQLQKSRGEHPDRSPHVTTAAQEHAAYRLRDTFTQEQLVAEFRALRASVIRRWADQLAEVGPPALEELTRFNESVDQLLTESLSWYDRELQETRRQADEARRQREESYRALAELNPDATMVYAGKRIVYANGAAARLLGADSPHALVGRSPLEITDPVNHEHVCERIQLALSGQTTPLVEYEWRRLDGTHVEVEVAKAPIPWDGDTAVQVIARDVSARKRAEQTLRESEERFRVMANGLPLIIWVHDARGAQEFVNQTFCEFFGVTPQEMTGDRWQLRMHPEDADAYRDEFLACIRDRRPFHREVRVRAADGEWRWIESWGRPRLSPDGTFLGFVGASADITARKRNEDALRESEAKLIAIVDQLPVGIGVTDLAGRTLSLNPAALQMHGLASADAMPGSLEGYREKFDLYYPDGRHMPAEEWPLARALRGEYVSQYEVRLRRHDGEERYIAYSAVSVAATSRGASLIVFLMQDITESKHTQGILTRTLAQSQAIFDQMTEGLVVFDPNGNLLDMNPAALKIHGFETVESLRRNLETLTDVFELFDLQGRPLPTDAWPIGRALRGETFRAYEVRVRRADTGKSWIGSYGGSPVHDPDGRLLLAVVTLRDVTAEREAESALSVAKKRLETALTATEVGVWYWDVSNNRMRGDRNILKLFGLSEADHDVPLEVFVDCVHQDDRADVVAEVQRAVADGSLYEKEYRVVHPDGRVRWIHARGRVETDEGGRAIAFPGVAVDVTERKRAEEAVREADQRKTEFLATLAHELRNPLAPIQSGMELLRLTDGSVPRWDRTLDIMQRQMVHLVRLVDDLLDVSRISHGKVALRREQVDVVEAVRRAVEVCTASFAGARQVSVDFPSESLMVEADPIRLAQIVSNLLNNAVKYTSDDGRIWIAVTREDSQARITIRDDGLGIAPGMLEDVFSLFRQADPVRASGLGIGLTLARSLVELHGGTIQARSDGPGCGSEFIVCLPLHEARADVEPSRERRTERASLAGRRILVVDDNPDVAESLAMLLSTRGADVRTAHDGRSALSMIEAFQPRAVLLDIGMPGMNGYDVARSIRARNAAGGVLLIAVTGWGQEEDRRRVKEAGFDHHLVKPVSLADIESLLRSAGNGQQ